MKRLILLVMLALPLMAKDQYKICIASQAGQDCSHQLFDKKNVFKIRDLFAQAPIPADYSVWVEDAKTGQTVRGPNDPQPQEQAPPVNQEKREKL